MPPPAQPGGLAVQRVRGSLLGAFSYEQSNPVSLLGAFSYARGHPVDTKHDYTKQNIDGVVSQLVRFSLWFWEGYHKSRRCSRDTYLESYITKYTRILRKTSAGSNGTAYAMK